VDILLENLMVLLLNSTKVQSQKVQEFKIKLLVGIVIIKVARELTLSVVDSKELGQLIQQNGTMVILIYYLGLNGN